MFNRCNLLRPARSAAVALCFVAGMVNAEGTQTKPNIILFISDDHGWADSAAYGGGYVQTPNIDRLAKQGMRFDSAFAATPLCDKTLFIYTSDQGANWPFGKWCVYDGGLRVPLIARWPGKITPGSVTDAMANLVDLLPTCIAAAGGNVPKDIDGRSFLPVMTGKESSHRKMVFGTHTGNDNGGPGVGNHCPARTVRTPTHRYILNLSPETTFTTHITGVKRGPHYLPHWDSWIEKAKTDPSAKAIVERYQHRPKEELYDMEKDPFEMNNLAGNPEYLSLLEDMRQKLSSWRRSQNDFEQDEDETFAAVRELMFGPSPG